MPTNYLDILSSTDENNQTSVCEPTVAAGYTAVRHSSASLLQRFTNHYEAWNEDTMFENNPYQIVANTHFNAIVNMGSQVVPYIINEIKKEPSFLYHALELIFNKQIIRTEREGGMLSFNVKGNCKAWVENIEKMYTS